MADPATPVRAFRSQLRTLEREIEQSMVSETGCCGITLAQCHLLLGVAERGQTSVTELAGMFELDKSTLSRTVEIACKAGLLSREVEPTNRRQQVIRLTEAGQQMADRINELCDASCTTLFDFIPAEKRGLVVEAVSILAEAMRRKRKNPGSACCKEQA